MGTRLIFLFDEAAFLAINGFIVQYLTTQLDASLVLANAIFSLFGLMGALTHPISGWITQKWNNHRWVLLVGLIVAVIYTALVFQLKDPMLYYPLSILAGIVGGAVPSILWQFTPNTVEDADIPAANAFMAFTQNIGMTTARSSSASDRHVGLEHGLAHRHGAPVHHLPHHLLRVWRSEEAQASVVSSTRDASSFETAHPLVRSLPFEHRERKLELCRVNPWSQASANAISDAKYEGISQGGPRFPHLCTILNSRT